MKCQQIYVAGSTPYTYSLYRKRAQSVYKEHRKLFHWFSANGLVANAGKFHLLPSSKISIEIHISNTEILKVELLGVNREGRVDFDFHVNTLFEKAS